MGYEGSIVTYEVTLGYHSLLLRVLHVGRAIGQAVGQKKEKKIGYGAFGQIYEKRLISEKFVSKRRNFSYATTEEI